MSNTLSDTHFYIILGIFTGYFIYLLLYLFLNRKKVNKVYCSKCRHLLNDYGSNKSFCKESTLIKKEDWYSDESELQQCSIKNKNNDCQDYEENSLQAKRTFQ